MNRRSFITALVGGIAAAGIGGFAAADAAVKKPPTARDPRDPEALEADAAAKIDESDVQFAQYYYYRRPRYYVRPRYYYRPRYYVRPRYYYRPRYFYRRRYW